MEKPVIRVLFFDFCGVCVRFDLHRFIENFSKVVQLPEAAIEAVLLSGRAYSPFFEAFECGEIGPTQFFHLLTNALNCAGRVDYETFARLWVDVFEGENTELDQLLARLPQQKYLLSNINKILHGRYVADCTIIRNHFRDRKQRVLSYDVGVIKPNPLIYKIALARANVPAEAAVFVDDVPENVAAWQALGGHGIVYNAKYDPIQKLEAELRALGVLA